MDGSMAERSKAKIIYGTTNENEIYVTQVICKLTVSSVER